MSKKCCKHSVEIVQTPPKAILEPLLAESAQRHQHLCPRQVLGVRMGLFGLRLLGFVDDTYSPRFVNEEKRLLTIAETDGCGADGIAVATNCFVGRRTLRVVDYGKVAATFIDTKTGRSIRIAPSHSARDHVIQFAPEAPSQWHAYRTAYQIMPNHLLLQAQKIALTQPLAQILSKPHMRAICSACGEEIMNERELLQNGRILCRACAGDSYYRLL